MAAFSNYLENKFIDWLLRAQAFTPPVTTYLALYTTAPTAAGGGTEVSTTSTGYARQPITSALANWAGTQGAGTTVASSGTSGATSNNGTLTFGASTAAWGTVVAAGLLDAATGGNLLFFGNLTTSQAVGAAGITITFNPATYSITLQ